jgi:hypothetical protein
VGRGIQLPAHAIREIQTIVDLPLILYEKRSVEVHGLHVDRLFVHVNAAGLIGEYLGFVVIKAYFPERRKRFGYNETTVVHSVLQIVPSERVRECIHHIHLSFAIRLRFEKVVRIEIVKKEEGKPAIGLQTGDIFEVNGSRSPKVIKVAVGFIVVAGYIEAKLIVDP